MTLAILHTVIALCAVLVICIALYAVERNCRTPQRVIRGNRRTGPGCVPADLFQATLDGLARDLDGLPPTRADRLADQWRSDTGLLRGRHARTDWQAVIRNPIKRTRP